ncbi:MAG: cytoplasmic protein [Sarcina sp.]
MVEKLECIGSELFNSKGIIFRVKDGKGILRVEIVEDENGYRRVCCTLGGSPLIMYDNEYCPTCSVMVQLAEGREAVDEDILEILSNMNTVISLYDGFEKLKPILSLLSDGYYILNDSDMIPTDGFGNLFWSIDGKGKDSLVSADYYLQDEGIICGIPKFLISTQGMECYNKERVEYYRGKIKNGETPYAFAIEGRGYSAMLIDGHHKATAAFLESQQIKCLTISPCKVEKNCLCYQGGFINLESLKYGDKIKANEFIRSDDIKIVFSGNNKEVEELKLENKKFPTLDDVAKALMIDDISDEVVKGYFDLEENNSSIVEFYLCYSEVFNNSSFKDLCLKLLNNYKFKNLWWKCIEYLVNFNDEETENALIKFLVAFDKFDNIREYDYCKSMIDEYFNGDFYKEENIE